VEGTEVITLEDQVRAAGAGIELAPEQIKQLERVASLCRELVEAKARVKSIQAERDHEVLVAIDIHQIPQPVIARAGMITGSRISQILTVAD